MVTSRKIRAAVGCALLLATAPTRAAEPEAAPTAAPDEPNVQDATADQADEQPASEPNALSHEPAPSTVEPELHHAPPAAAPPHEDIRIRADILHPERVARAMVRYRVIGETQWRSVRFLRSGKKPYVATIPAKHARAPGLEYYVVLETVEGANRVVFASAESPHPVQISEDLTDLREEAQLERLDGRRSVASAFGEFVDFGQSRATLIDASGIESERLVNDRYYRVEGAYTYRVLRTVNQFSVRAGVVRGQSPVPAGSNDLDVGLNYASPSLRLRLTDAWHIEGSALMSVTEVGFSLGAGGALHIGDPFGSKLTFGFETIEVFGSRFFAQVDIRATDRLRLTPIVEATDMPHADRYGVRFFGEASYRIIGGLSANLRGGYQAREATSGGVAAGGGVALAF